MTESDAAHPARVHRYRDADELAQHVAQRLVEHLGLLQRTQPVVHLCLGGGGVANTVLAHFGAAVPEAELDPKRLELWWSDDRYLAAGDEQRHSHQSLTRLAAHFTVEPARTHLMPTPVGTRDVSSAALVYAAELGTTEFDVTLLPVHADGHVAALGACCGDVPASSLATGCVGWPDAPEGMVTLTPAALSRSREVWLLATTEASAAKLPSIIAGTADGSAARVRGIDATEWFIDRDAGSQLPYYICA